MTRMSGWISDPHLAIVSPRAIAKWLFMSLFMTILTLTGLIFSIKANAAPLDSRTGKHVITVYDDGVEKGFVTEADTLEEALKQEGITISRNDVTEPALSEKLVAATYSVNVYRARPVLVVDGNKTSKVLTPYQTGEQIAEQADLSLNHEDTVKFEASTDPIADGAFEKMVIQRATEINLVLYGKETVSYTQKSTVGEMLAEKGIKLESSDTVSPNISTRLTEKMKVEVWRDGKQTTTQEEVINKPIEEIKDADKETGFREVKTPGTDGAKNVTYEIEMRNGKEVARKEIASVTTKEPVKEVVIVGTKPKVAPYTGGGSKDEWLRAAGIPESDWGYADAIVSRESGWNPNATNRSSGACGLAQALPCSKVPGNPYNPVDSLRWMDGYVKGRYGGWAGAYNFWMSNHWY